jgi:hypothetical protein
MTSIPFTWKLYNTGIYDAVTRDGSMTVIKVFRKDESMSFDTEESDYEKISSEMYPYVAIFDGRLRNDVGYCNYARNGYFYSGDQKEGKTDPRDLVLVTKKVKKLPTQEYIISPELKGIYTNVYLKDQDDGSKGLYYGMTCNSYELAVAASKHATGLIATLSLLDIPAVKEILIAQGLITLKT